MFPLSGYLLTGSSCSSPVTLGKMRLPEASPQLSKENCHLYYTGMWHPTPAVGSALFLPHSKSLKYYSMICRCQKHSVQTPQPAQQLSLLCHSTAPGVTVSCCSLSKGLSLGQGERSSVSGQNSSYYNH